MLVSFVVVIGSCIEVSQNGENQLKNKAIRRHSFHNKDIVSGWWPLSNVDIRGETESGRKETE